MEGGWESVQCGNWKLKIIILEAIPRAEGKKCYWWATFHFGRSEGYNRAKSILEGNMEKLAK